MRLNASARRNKPKARLNAYEALLAEDRNVKLDQVQIHIPAGPRLGDIVVEANGLRKAYGDRVLIDDLTFNLPRGGIVGVIGPNGAGKTTLLRMITGQEQPDAGTLRIGETVELAYVDQSRDALDPDKTVWEEISGGEDQIKLGDRTVNSRAYVSGFNFKGSDQQKKVAQALRRRAQPAAPGEAAADAAATCCCSTSRPTTSTSTRCARSKRRCSRSPAARWSSPTIAGSWTGSPRTCSRSRATRRSAGSRATSRPTRASATSSSAPTPTGRSGSRTRSSSAAEPAEGGSIAHPWDAPALVPPVMRPHTRPDIQDRVCP